MLRFDIAYCVYSDNMASGKEWSQKKWEDMVLKVYPDVRFVARYRLSVGCGLVVVVEDTG